LWETAAAELGTRGRCITYDRRGFGRSAPPEPVATSDLRDHVEDATALLTGLAAAPAVVIGRSTGGQIAVALAHHHPEVVRALVLLEPAVFTMDAEAAAWAEQLRARTLAETADAPSAAAEVVIRTALGDEMWDGLPEEIRELFTAASPAVLAEIRGVGLDLSARPLVLSADELAAMAQPTLLVSSEDSPHVMRRVNDSLAGALPNTEHVIVPGGHLINPADPAVLDFVDRAMAG
jgi:pimeloyl-ACP methyl ester carboxylesterase